MKGVCDEIAIGKVAIGRSREVLRRIVSAF